MPDIPPVYYDPTTDRTIAPIAEGGWMAFDYTHHRIPTMEHLTEIPEGAVRLAPKAGTSLTPDARSLPWRVGRHLGRTLYAQVGPAPSDQDILLGLLDDREHAEHAVALRNAEVLPGPRCTHCGAAIDQTQREEPR